MSTKKRLSATQSNTQNPAALLQKIAQRGGSPEGFYDFSRRRGARLGMQLINRVFTGAKRIHNLWWLSLIFYLKSLPKDAR